MSAGASVAQRFPRVTKRAQVVLDGWYRMGGQAEFYGKTLDSVGDAVTRYQAELIRLIAAMSLGTGALVMIGGTTAIVGFL
ncbi:MAG: phospholipid/cholesterol/gamma-HCH transport system permease protein, partial [Mycobacterium sp.]|nr:phospholipid/cholesterol/gamma-HCH transport system permease protein [Mycobacterium sp.]